MSSDIYFTLMHYASGEEQITDAEWVYFLQCLKEKEVFLCMIRMRKWQEDYKC